jgi:hypothetical protein
MKQIVYLIAIILLAGHSVSLGQRPGFFIKCSEAEGDTASKYVKNFERLVGKNLSEAFHCATVHANHQLNSRLKWEKAYQLNGGDADFKVCDYLKADYLVLLSMIEGNQNQLQVKATCIDYRNEKNVIASEVLNLTTSLDYAGFAESCSKISEKLITELGKFEICAFTGPVSVSINSVIDSTNIEDYAVYCNGMDQRYRKEITINNTTLSDWKLQRKGIPWTDGTMTFYTTEETIITEENGCYKCKSGREGGRTQTQTSSMKVKGSGISHESFRNGKPQDDTRIELKFMENGTYYVIAKGTSQPVTGEDKVAIKAIGTCDNLTQETKVVPREIKIPLKQIFGPYQGKTTDKILQQKETKEVTNPATNEKSTLTIDFTLNQKDK